MTRRSFLQTGLAAGAVGLAGVACRSGHGVATGGGTPAAQRTRRLTLSWWVDSGLPTPFAFSSLGPGGVVKVSLLYDALLWKDANGLVPWLAAAHELSDAQTVTFKLRPGVSWHDGQPFSADDVAFSFNYYAQHAFAWADTSVVEAATAIDAQTVTLKLARPFAPFLHDVAGMLPMLPRHVWTDVGDPLHYSGPGATVGTGPFTFTSYSEAQGAYLLSANDRFFAGRPGVSELAYALVPQAQQPVALQNGSVDGALAMDFDVQKQFQSGRYRVLATQPFSIVRLLFNVDRPPFDQPAFRQAIAFALDRQGIGQRVIHGDVVVGHPGLIPPESPWYSSDVTQYPFDPARANGLLDGLGYKQSGGPRQTAQGSPLRVQLLADPNDADAPLIQAGLAQVGIGVDIVGTDAKTRTDRQGKLDYQMALTGHIGVGGDPDFLRQWYAGQGGNAFSQGNVLHDATFAQIAQQQAAELDDGKRHALVAQLQRILSDDLPSIALYHRRFYWIYNPTPWSRWFNTWSGIMNGIPLADNKLALLQR